MSLQNCPLVTCSCVTCLPHDSPVRTDMHKPMALPQGRPSPGWARLHWGWRREHWVVVLCRSAATCRRSRCSCSAWPSCSLTTGMPCTCTCCSRSTAPGLARHGRVPGEAHMVQCHPLQPGGWTGSSSPALRTSPWDPLSGCMGLCMMVPGRSLHGRRSAAVSRAASGGLPHVHEGQPAILSQWTGSSLPAALCCCALQNPCLTYRQPVGARSTLRYI